MTGLLALTGIVILVSALASGPFERRGISLMAGISSQITQIM